MIEFDTFLHRLCSLIVGILIIAILLLAVSRGIVSASSSAGSTDIAGNPNVVAGSMTAAVNGFGVAVSSTGRGLGHAMDSTGYAIRGSTHAVAAITTHSVQFVALAAYHSTRFVGHTAEASLVFTGRSLIDGVAFTFDTTAHIMNLASSVAVTNVLTQPADKVSAPVISPLSALAVMPMIKTATPQTAPVQVAPPQATSTAPQWPIHGVITTLFGVPELPYEAIHTGLDISDGKAPGTTPIKPYRPGVVSEIVRSSLGLGNHIVIDHGGGVTSVYGHLNSISVQMGQQVDENTILGFEGTTGASTGTHLHFEIRINGQPVNPLDYVSGRP